MKVLVLGSNGMAGHMIVKYLRTKKDIELTTFGRSGTADFSYDVEHDLNPELSEYDYVINCIGLLVKASYEDPKRAYFLNSHFPHALEYLTRWTKTRVIHLSTDCVFDGKRGYYKETDIPDETLVYGKTKIDGELVNDKDITLRTSIIGPELKIGTGLHDWFLRQRETVRGYDNVFWSGVTTLELAKVLYKIMNEKIPAGLYHVSDNLNRISKYQLLCALNEIYQTKKKIIRAHAEHDSNKILVNTKYDFGISDYLTQLNELKTFSKLEIGELASF